MGRARLRDVGIGIGHLPTGEHNAITDVPGVRVGHVTIIEDSPRVIRTGVTMIAPRAGEVWHDYAFAGYHSFNGNGEMTGLPWLEESGMLGSAVGITNTHQVGVVRDALVRHAVDIAAPGGFFLPVVAETCDGWLNDIDAFAVTEHDGLAALAAAAPGPVPEGNVGGGTGMICHEFKGGIGTSSRIATTGGKYYAVGVLVQANYGSREDLRVDGNPVGRRIGFDVVPAPWPEQRRSGSIIVVIATDAPLLPTQCRRIAKRATVGLARAGGIGHNSSGDIFLAFSTGNHLPAEPRGRRFVEMLPHALLDPIFSATADATEEAILNALCAAETMGGRDGRIAHALPLDVLAEAIDRAH
jgi:D-aminopeptidase